MIEHKLIHNGFHLPFLEDVLFWQKKYLSGKNILYRSSETSSLARILKFGTDRGGFPPRVWQRDPAYQHEDIIIGTTEAEIRHGELSGESHSLKKFKPQDQPLLLLYDADCLEKVCSKNYRLQGGQWQDALLAIIYVEMVEEIQGWFCLEDGLAYQELLYQKQPETMLEIGVWKGRSLSFIANAVHELGIRLSLVDHWQGSNDKFRDGYKKILEGENVELCCENNLKKLSLNPQLYSLPSSVAAAEISNHFDLIFLDASHDYQSVKNDLHDWHDRLNPGGVFAGHDYSIKFPGLIQAIGEFTDQQQLKIQTRGKSVWLYLK